MVRRTRASLVLAVAASFPLTVCRPARADDPAPAQPPGNAPSAPAHRASLPEANVMRALLQAMGRVMVTYLEEKQDPEKAAAYEDILRALAGVMTHLDPGDERAAVAAGMKAMIDLLPTMNTPKRSAVMRGVMSTMAHAVAEGLEAGSTAPGPAAHPGDTQARVVVETLLGGIADGLLGEITSHAFFGAELAAPPSGRDGFPVTAVRPGSRAERFGLRVGDTILRIQGAPARWRSLLRAGLALHRDGEFPPLTVLRDGQEVELAPPPASPPVPPAPPNRPR